MVIIIILISNSSFELTEQQSRKKSLSSNNAKSYTDLDCDNLNRITQNLSIILYRFVIKFISGRREFKNDLSIIRFNNLE